MPPSGPSRSPLGRKKKGGDPESPALRRFGASLPVRQTIATVLSHAVQRACMSAVSTDRPTADAFDQRAAEREADAGAPTDGLSLQITKLMELVVSGTGAAPPMAVDAESYTLEEAAVPPRAIGHSYIRHNYKGYNYIGHNDIAGGGGGCRWRPPRDAWLAAYYVR